MKNLKKKREYSKNNWLDPRIEIKNSPLQGKGMFALKQIKKGEVVVIWGLKEWYTTKEEAENAAKDDMIVEILDDDLFTLDDVDKREDDPTHFMNHSCDCNVWFEDEVTLVARRDIETGEELTLDYALRETTDEWIPSWTCGCKSSLCRGKFTGKDWLIPELQERYKGHFLPYNNKQIERLKQKNKKGKKFIFVQFLLEVFLQTSIYTLIMHPHQISLSFND